MIGPFFYRVRLVKGAPWSAVKLWKGFSIDPDTLELLTERPFIWRAILNGEHVDVYDVVIEFDGITQMPVVKGEQVNEAEYEFLLGDHLWAKAHAPDEPAAKPRERVDMNSIPPIKW